MIFNTFLSEIHASLQILEGARCKMDMRCMRLSEDYAMTLIAGKPSFDVQKSNNLPSIAPRHLLKTLKELFAKIASCICNQFCILSQLWMS
jgi:hypothetical protein